MIFPVTKLAIVLTIVFGLIDCIYSISELAENAENVNKTSIVNPIFINFGPVVKPPICVVGAGLSGLNVANLLQDQGHKVIVFEKRARVGGKIITLRVLDSIQVEMGPIIFTSSDKKISEKVAQFQLTLVPINQTDTRFFNPYTGTIYPVVLPTGEEQLALGLAIKRYGEIQKSYEQNLEFEYLNIPSDSELFGSAEDFLIANELLALRPVFVLLMTLEGYSVLQDLPALYMLKFINYEQLIIFATDKGLSAYKLAEGYDTLAKEMAKPLNVYLKREVVSIVRINGENQRLHFQTGEQALCRKVILAYPPLLQNLEKIIPDLDSNEKNVLGMVRVNKYISALTYIPDLPTHALFGYAEPAGDGQVMALYNQYTKKQNMYTGYSYMRGDYKGAATSDDKMFMTLLLKETLMKLSNGSRILWTAPGTDYFPHVVTTALRQGFYRDFAKIQGNRGLYYSTTLLGFENMNGALETSESFVQKYFPVRDSY